MISYKIHDDDNDEDIVIADCKKKLPLLTAVSCGSVFSSKVYFSDRKKWILSFNDNALKLDD